MKIVSLGLILIAIILTVGCSGDDSSSPSTGQYRYTAFLNSTLVVEGTIQIYSLTHKMLVAIGTFMLLVNHEMTSGLKLVPVILLVLWTEVL